MKKLTYFGDGNIAYGGYFVNLDTWDDGFADVVRVTDMDGAAGVKDVLLIEHLVIYTGSLEDKRDKTLRLAISGTGLGYNDVMDMPELQKKHHIVDALLTYGAYDLDDAWLNYQQSSSEYVYYGKDRDSSYRRIPARKSIKRWIIENHLHPAGYTA